MNDDHLQRQAGDKASFQARVQSWMLACFGDEISSDRTERGDRLLEEVFELLQSGGYDPARVLALRDYVWSREAGEPAQEVGGVQVTLAAYCLAHDLDMHEAGETELARVWTKVEKIRAKQAAKPTGSALPQVWPVSTSESEITALRAQVSALTAERDRLLAAQGWQDIATAPKDGTTVILCDNRVAEGYIAVASRKLMHGESLWVHAEGTVGYPDGFFTHWMPPPAPPAPGGER